MTPTTSMTALSALMALTAFRIAAYIRSHRIYQALLPIFALLAISYATRAPAGQEASALTDSAVLVIPFLAWSARSLLDTEPDTQRILSATSVGSRSREVLSGLLAAFAVNLLFAAITLFWGLFLGLTAFPTASVLWAGVALHVLAALTGTTLGALTSRAILPSPAISIMALVLGFLAMLVLSRTALYWLTVPLTAWMKAAGTGTLVTQMPWLGALSLAWLLAGLTLYTWLRRTRS
ncbi:hypothetical protein ACIBG7_00235 [Nonomuraea sp. NPDC050328]|uniref:hypothetical protein n=1 Tax=Nonomuraea sp. NPDC050328 TaxID=3364361 RepID=UPI00379EB015